MNSTVAFKNFDKYLLIPFVDGGRDLSGCDCLGLARLIFGEFGIEFPDFKICCSLSLKINETINQQRQFWTKIEKPEEPSLVLMRTNPKYPTVCNHLGVYVGNNTIFHTMRKIGVSKTNINHPYFKHTIEGFYVPRI